MPLGEAEVNKVFLLSRITPREGEVEKFSTQLDAVLNYMETLDELDTEHVDPVGNITGLRNVFREDKAADSMPVSEVLKNAPSEDGESFKVPKVF